MLELLASLLLAVAAAVPPESSGCPSGDAVAAELDRLGASTALAALGSPEVTIKDKTMRVVLRGRDGSIVGAREVAVPDACHERASVAAVFLAAWVGVWSTEPAQIGGRRRAEVATTTGAAVPKRPMGEIPGNSSERASATRREVTRPPGLATASPGKRTVSPLNSQPVSPQSVPPPPATSAPAPPPPPPPPTTPPPALSPPRGPEPSPSTLPQRGPSIEVAGLAFGTHDGNAGALGGSVLAGHRLGESLAVSALVESVTTRQTALGPGLAEYRTSRLGIGLSVIHRWNRVFVDVGLVPELTMFTGSGQQLVTQHSTTTWGAALDLRGRVGLALGRLVPFVYTGGSGMLRAERLTLDNSTQNTTLSRWSVSAGVGLGFLLGGTNR